MNRIVRRLFTSWVIVLGLSLIPSLLGAWVYHELPKRLNVRIDGLFSSRWLSPVFHVRNVRVLWRNKGEILSGDIRVEYDFWRLILSREMKVRISGSNLPVRLDENLGLVKDTNPVIFKTVAAELVLGAEGIREMISFRAESPSVQFRIGSSEK